MRLLAVRQPVAERLDAIAEAAQPAADAIVPSLSFRSGTTRMRAMEIHPGVFVTSTATREWRPDPEVGGGAEEHVLFDNGAMRAGLTRFASNADPEPPPWALEQTEVLLVLEGAARVEIEGGPTLDLKPGDLAALPKGAVTRWHLTLPFKEVWVLA